MTIHDLCFLHTDEVHIPVFTALVEAQAAEQNITVNVRHDVRDDLLARAQEQGMSESLATDVTAAMHTAADSGARVVVCTCSTIGGVAEAASADNSAFLSARIDRAMADVAVGLGGQLLVVAALESTLDSTRRLIEGSAANARIDVAIDMHVVPDAWQHFMAGEITTYCERVATDIRTLHTGYSGVVLAQASMAPAATLCSDLPVPVLSSPALGVNNALNTLVGRVSRP